METFGNLITQVIADFISTINEKVVENFGALNDAIYPIWVIGITVYFIFIIYSMMYQNKDVEIQEFIKHMAVLAIITAFLGTAGKDGFYTKNVIPFVMNSGNTLSSIVMEGDGSESLVQGLFNRTADMIRGVWLVADKEWGLDGIGAKFMALVQTILLLAGGVILALFAFVYIVITTLMVGILLSIGGIFIMFSAFPTTRQMFSSWVGACLNYIFLNVSFSIAFSIILAVINEYTKGIGVGINILTSIAIFFLYAAGILMLQQITTLTSSLTGGVGINGLTSSIRSALPEKTLGKAGRAIGGYAWGKTGAPVTRKVGQGWNSTKSAMKDMLGLKNNNIRG